MSDYHDKNGKFKKGNSAASLQKTSSLIKGMKKEMKDDLCRILYSIFNNPWVNLRTQVENPECSQFEYLVAHAINKKNYKFIQWLTEYVLGRQKEVTEIDDDVVQVIINGVKNRP